MMSGRSRLFLITCLVLASEALGQSTRPLGSERGARVAYAMEDGPVELTFLARQMRDEEIAELRRLGSNVRILVPGSREEALELAPQVHGMDAVYCSPEFLRKASKLRWVQSSSAGVDRYLSIAELRNNDEIVLTNMRAAHGPTIADHVFAMLLSQTRDLRYYLDPANRGTWNRRGSGVEPIALQGRTLLVVGLGGIGSEVARRGKGFGMRVFATRRSDVPPPSFVDRQEKPDRLHALLGESDIVAICLPLTDETRGLFDERAFATMKSGSYIINIGRGPIIDTAALVEALQSKHLAGACLDVTDPEPLPPDHVLWSMPNVVITPHVSGRSTLTGDRRQEIYAENMRRFAAGEPLLNVVDKKAGY